MPYARCSECGQTIQVESVSNDVMMMWHGTHCGSSQAYFADNEIFETADDVEKKRPGAGRITTSRVGWSQGRRTGSPGEARRREVI
jgi:hypothetical protein